MEEKGRVGHIHRYQGDKRNPFLRNNGSTSLTTVIRTPPLDADVEFVAGRRIGCQRHALVVDVLFISYPDVAEGARRHLKPQKSPSKDEVLLRPFKNGPFSRYVRVPA